MPNGINLNVWGPISVRHNDLTSLRDSDANQKIADLQVNEPLQWVIYGDSAYVHVPDMVPERDTITKSTLSVRTLRTNVSHLVVSA
jgi:hypothetical protein